MCVLIFSNSMDAILLDKVMKKTPKDLQKRFPIYHACPKYLATPRERLSIPSEIGRGKNIPSRIDSASLISLESFMQLISFCNS